MTTGIKAINKALEIVKLGTQRFIVNGGYIMPTGYAFKHPTLGYLGFKDRPDCPYIPLGGQNALKEIQASGGFTSLEGIIWLQEM